MQHPIMTHFIQLSKSLPPEKVLIEVFYALYDNEQQSNYYMELRNRQYPTSHYPNSQYNRTRNELRRLSIEYDQITNFAFTLLSNMGYEPNGEEEEDMGDVLENLYNQWIYEKTINTPFH